MAITTYSKDSAEWWKKKDVEVSLAFSADGIDYWSIDVEPDNKELTNPEYVQLVVEEMQQYPDILKVRFAPTLYAVAVGGEVAMMPDKQGKMALPLCRSLKLLRSVFTRPDKNQTPKYKELKRNKQILNVMKRMASNGVHKVSYFVNETTVETFDIENVVNILDTSRIVLAHADGSIAQ